MKKPQIVAQIEWSIRERIYEWVVSGHASSQKPYYSFTQVMYARKMHISKHWGAEQLLPPLSSSLCHPHLCSEPQLPSESALLTPVMSLCSVQCRKRFFRCSSLLKFVSFWPFLFQTDSLHSRFPTASFSFSPNCEKQAHKHAWRSPIFDVSWKPENPRNSIKRFSLSKKLLSRTEKLQRKRLIVWQLKAEWWSWISARKLLTVFFCKENFWQCFQVEISSKWVLSSLVMTMVENYDSIIEKISLLGRIEPSHVSLTGGECVSR